MTVSMRTADRLRGPRQLLLLPVLAGFLLVGAVGLLTSGWLGAVLWGAMAVGASVLLVRSLRMSVTVNDEQLVHRDLLWTTRYNRADIEDVTVDLIDNKILFDVFAPVINCRCGSDALAVLARPSFMGRTGPPRALTDQATYLRSWAHRSAESSP